MDQHFINVLMIEANMERKLKREQRRREKELHNRRGERKRNYIGEKSAFMDEFALGFGP